MLEQEEEEARESAGAGRRGRGDWRPERVLGQEEEEEEMRAQAGAGDPLCFPSAHLAAFITVDHSLSTLGSVFCCLILVLFIVCLSFFFSPSFFLVFVVLFFLSPLP